MKDKLTVITPYFPNEESKYSGIFVYEQLEELSRYYSSIDVLVLMPLVKISRKFPFVQFNSKQRNVQGVRLDNVNVIKVTYFPFPKDSLLYHKSISLALLFSRIDFSQTILAHTIYPVASSIRNRAKRLFTVIHGTDLRYFSSNPAQLASMKDVIRNAKGVVCVSKGLLEDLITLSLFKENCEVIENGLPIQDNVGTIRQGSDSVFKFVYLGRLIRQKGIFELLQAYRAVQVKYGDRVQLHVIGSGEDESELRDITATSELEHVVFHGALDNKEALSLVSAMNVLVLPSYKEGFGRVIIEALSFGVPVISTVSGGPEFIVNSSNGLLCSPGNVDELAEAMLNVIENYRFYNREQISSHTKEVYALEKQTYKLFQVLSRS